MIARTRLDLVENAINRVLAADPDSPARLARLAGRRLRIDSYLAEDFAVTVHFDEDGLRLSEDDTDVDAAIRGGPAGFLRAAANPSDRGVFHDGSLVVTGDAHLVEAAVGLLRHYRVDLAGKLSPLLGDTATGGIERLLDALRQGATDLRGKLVADGGDYLREESRLAASREALDALADAVDELRADTARLDKRIEALEKGRS